MVLRIVGLLNRLSIRLFVVSKVGRVIVVYPGRSLLDSSLRKESAVDLALDFVRDEMDALRERLPGYLRIESNRSQELLDYVLSTKGKLLRPALFFLASRLCRYSGDSLLSIGAVCEFVHIASLLHDDVVDHSLVRRHKSAAHVLWGDESAVLVGDFIYSAASCLMVQSRNLDIVEGFSCVINRMSQSELLQIESAYDWNLSIRDYLKIIEGKTSVLIGMACKAAGLLAYSDKEEIAALELFGTSLGMAFQLMDDVIDYSESSALIGKDLGADLREGRVTLPILLVQQHITGEDLVFVREVFRARRFDSDCLVALIRIVRDSGVLEKVKARASTYIDTAIEGLCAQFTQSKERDCLIALANGLRLRVC